MPNLETLLTHLHAWIITRPEIQAAALVGSYARGTARPDSDLDLVLLVENPLFFRTETAWLAEINWSALTPVSWRDADYGALWSRHVLFSNGLEIEFGFSSPQWAKIDPVDAGTLKVMQDGCRILWDRAGLLAALQGQIL